MYWPVALLELLLLVGGVLLIGGLAGGIVTVAVKGRGALRRPGVWPWVVAALAGLVMVAVLAGPAVLPPS